MVTKEVWSRNLTPECKWGKVWKKMSKANQKLIIQELRAEIVKMRASTKPLIGCVGLDGEIEKDDPYWNPYNPDTRHYSVDYFASESEFDACKVEQNAP
jgi:hypothetical protein